MSAFVRPLFSLSEGLVGSLGGRLFSLRESPPGAPRPAVTLVSTNFASEVSGPRLRHLLAQEK